MLAQRQEHCKNLGDKRLLPCAQARPGGDRKASRGHRPLRHPTGAARDRWDPEVQHPSLDPAAPGSSPGRPDDATGGGQSFLGAARSGEPGSQRRDLPGDVEALGPGSHPFRARRGGDGPATRRPPSVKNSLPATRSTNNHHLLFGQGDRSARGKHTFPTVCPKGISTFIVISNADNRISSQAMRLYTQLRYSITFGR